EYYEHGGDAVVQVSWAATSGGGCATGQFFAEYFSNIALTPPATRTACESTINNNYGAGGPTGLPTDNFSARWTGRFPFAAGNAFASGATVLWNGAARTTTFVSATRVTASISAADIAAAGSVPVTVRNPNGQTSGPQTFTIAPAGGGDTIKVFITEPASGA